MDKQVGQYCEPLDCEACHSWQVDADLESDQMNTARGMMDAFVKHLVEECEGFTEDERIEVIAWAVNSGYGSGSGEG